MNSLIKVDREYKTIGIHANYAYLDFGIYAGETNFAVLSFFDGSEQTVRSVAASLVLGDGVYYDDTLFCNNEIYDAYVQQIVVGKSKVFHCLAVNRRLNKTMFLCREEDKETVLFDFLMQNYDYPLLYEWRKAIFNALDGKLFSLVHRAGKSIVVCGDRDLSDRFFEYKGERFYVNNLLCYQSGYNANLVGNVISELLRNKEISITKAPVKDLFFKSQDDYFKNYGASIVDNLRKIVRPEMELDGNIDIVFNTKSMFPQQIAVVNACSHHLIKNRTALLSCKMGTGKTLMALGIVEKYFVELAKRRGSIQDIKDAYKGSDSVNYRILVTCPGHLVSKWQEEIVKEVPFAKATILSDLDELMEVYNRGPARNGREYFICSKDSIKLTYQSIPTPRKIQSKYVSVKRCKNEDCDSIMRYGECKGCGGKEYKVIRSRVKREGLVCPYCNELLFAPGARVDELVAGEKSDVYPLKPIDFSNPTTSNNCCYYCGEELWEPYVKNIGTEFSLKKKRERAWYRATFYKDKALNGTVTCWVYKGKESDYIRKYGEMINDMEDRTHGVRKFAPSVFIEKKMRGYFDFLIADEVHNNKGGGTAQGASFQHTLNACKKDICLTGTLTGGTAADIFYIFWRLYPRMMRADGLKWSDIDSFSEEYGVVEKQFEYSGTEFSLNVNSRGRQISQPRVKPGISPRLFLKLIDKAVFLDIADLSSHLPKFYEKVVISDIDKDGSPLEQMMLISYHDNVSYLAEESMKKNSGGIKGKKMVYELAYLDKPYDASPIIHPATGALVLKPEDYSILVEGDGLLTKEHDLIKILRGELAEKRNCVVYAQFTGKDETNITDRLREIIMRECGLAEHEVVVLKANTPKADQREKWMHQKAERGMKVMICNPKCVETGLDFSWVNKKGVRYNYPTLIFYQMGNSLYTTMQAARRAWRLNQIAECRNYYMGVKGTRQQAWIQLIAEKTSANGVMEGRFSVDGLAAMAEGIDVEVRLAQIMAEMDTTTVDDLQSMFDVVNNANSDDDSAYGDYKKQMTYKELMGDEVVAIRTDALDMFSGFSNLDSLLGFGSIIGGNIIDIESNVMPIIDVEAKVVEEANGVQVKQSVVGGIESNLFNPFGMLISSIDVHIENGETNSESKEQPVVKRKRKKDKIGILSTMSLFDTE